MIGSLSFASIALLVLAGVLFIPIAIITLACMGIVQRMSLLPETLFEPAKEDERAFREAREWAIQNSFEYETTHLFNRQILVGFWRKPNTATFFCCYYARATSLLYYDFVTIFEKNHAITTSSSKDSMMLPQAPGAFRQCFQHASLDELYHHHSISKGYLESMLGLQERASLQSGKEIASAEIARQMSHIKTLPLWQLRGAYWFLVRRNRNLNIAISEFHTLDR